MTFEEYKRIGKKYNLKFFDYDNCFYLKGYQVTEFKGDETGGFGCVYCECVISNINNSIYPSGTHCSSLTAKGFEEQIQLFFRNYKKALIELKTRELEKDFK